VFEPVVTAIDWFTDAEDVVTACTPAVVVPAVVAVSVVPAAVLVIVVLDAAVVPVAPCVAPGAAPVVKDKFAHLEDGSKAKIFVQRLWQSPSVKNK
jgi:hypothetical protein